VEKIQTPEEETSDKDLEADDHILITPNVRELLVIRRAFHMQQVPRELSQRGKIFRAQDYWRQGVQPNHQWSKLY